MFKNITLSAPSIMLEKARGKAKNQKTSLNQLFRNWLQSYVLTTNPSRAYNKFLKQISYVNAGRKFNRDQLNAR